MSDDTKDPREAVLVDIICEEARREHGRPDPAADLALLDDADPLRAMLGDVVEMLSEARAPRRTVNDEHAVAWEFRRNRLVTRLRTLTPTEEDDGK